MAKCTISGCDEEGICICDKCGDKVCRMHTHISTDENNRSVFLCEDCYKG